MGSPDLSTSPAKPGDVLPPVYIEAYDPSWPEKFLEEKVLLQAVLAPWLAGEIEHIGSTSVPDLPAKPILDIGAPVLSLEASKGAIEAVAPLSYCYFPYKADQMHWFCKPSDLERTHHLHIVPADSPYWRDRLLFRDYLRAHPAAAEAYAALKRELAEAHRNDREAYTDLKGPFIQAILEAARREMG